MNNRPLISIVVPLYNSKNYIKQLLNNLLSIKKQSELEIVLVDDGSQDNTGSICLEFSKKNANIKYYYKENGGIDSSRNYGLEKSTGKYVFFHDHDDYINVKTLNYAMDSLLIKDNFDVFIFNSKRIEGEKEYNALKLNDYYILKHNGVANNRDLLNKVCHQKNNHNIASRLGYIWSMIVLKDFISRNGIMFKKRVNYEDDLMFCIQLFHKNPKTYLCNRTIYNWIMYKSSTSHASKYDTNYFQKIEFLKNDLEKIFENKLSDQGLVNNVLWGFYYNFFNFYLKKYNEPTFKMFKKIILKQDLRKKLITFNKRELSIKQKITILLIRLRLYIVVYYLFKNNHS